MAGKDPRGKLLDAAIDHIAARGISDLSLRELAAAIGTSHRMLIHHFGSREALWVEVIRAVEARQRALLAEVVPDPERGGSATSCASGGRTSPSESLWANERLFFEVYGQALQGRPGTVELLDGIVDSWLEPAAQGFMAYGLEREEALAQARLGLAVSRGLLLDLLATGDREAVDAANEAYIALVEARLAGYSGHHPPPDVRSRRIRRGGVIVALVALALPAQAHAAPRPFFDVRAQAREVTPPAATRALERRLGDQAVVELDPVTRTPRVLARLDGALSGPASGSAADVALRYVRANLAALGLTRGRPGHPAPARHRDRRRHHERPLAPGRGRDRRRRQRVARQPRRRRAAC